MSAAIKDDPDLDPVAEIYQRHLDVVSDLLFRGRAEECVKHFALPLLIRTKDKEELFETHADMLLDTQLHSESLRGHGVTNYIRLVKQARRLSDTLIEGWHETYILRHASSILPSYMSRMVLRLDEDGIWKVAEAEHELRNLRFPLHAVDSRPGSFSELWKNQRADIQGIRTQAEPIYAAYLAVLDQHQNNRNYESWAAQFHYPLTGHYDDHDRIFETADDMRGFFQAMCDRMTNPDQQIHRRIRSANFIAADRICGYHDTDIADGSDHVFGPVKSRMILTLNNGQWQCSSVTNSLSGATGDTVDLKIARSIPTMRQIQKRMKKS